MPRRLNESDRRLLTVLWVRILGYANRMIHIMLTVWGQCPNRTFSDWSSFHPT